MHIWTNKQLKTAGFLEVGWPLSGQEALKGQTKAKITWFTWFLVMSIEKISLKIIYSMYVIEITAIITFSSQSLGNWH